MSTPEAHNRQNAGNSPETNALSIGPVAASGQMESLKLLFSSLSPSQQLSEAQRLFQMAREGKVTLDGLLRADRAGRLAGVIWAQIQIGRTATVWQPRMTAAETEDEQTGQATARALVTAATSFLAGRDVCLGQMLSPSRDLPEVAAFEACGYEYLAELEYLFGTPPGGDEPTVAGLAFEPYSEANHDEFISAMERTYDETLDCPALNGIRSSDDVIAGYQATGTFAPERWFLLRYEDQAAGCLLLTDHAETDQYELVYMGLVPEARGNKLGKVVAQYALWKTHLAGRKRLVLAVDAKNEPAKAMYHACGLTAWERRHVWTRRFAEKK